MEKINVAELLKDCPKGMELDCIMLEGSVVFEDISDDEEYPIGINLKNGDYTNLTKYGQYLNLEEAKCVIFPKGKTTWEGFVPPCKFKDGDILTTDIGSIFIFSHLELDSISDRNICKAYVGIQNTMPISLFHTEQSDFFGPYESKCKLATKKEKQKLFQAIKDNGYKWNPETKTLEELIEPRFKIGDKIKCIKTGNIYEIIKIIPSCYIANYLGSDITILFNRQDEYELSPVEPKFKVDDKIKLKGGDEFGIITQVSDCFYTIKCRNNTHCWPIKRQDDWELVPDKFDITTLKPFDKVLVRCGSSDRWRMQFFEKYDETDKYPFICMWNNKYDQCIPYEGNENLLGTTDDCNKYFRTW